MATTATSSSSAADSYLGSLISLTSKSEIRYEGILFQINPEESSIGLRNVRSFGTEGRKKDGPQIPSSDKVYEHILFRGTDIKDLQVKASPPIQPTQPINHDPAIIQSHYSRPVTTSSSLPSTVGGSLTDLNSHASQLGLPGSTNFQGALPLYQPGGNLVQWGAAPSPPNANGVGLAMPMYWQGYYSTPNGLPHLHQQPLLLPALPGLAMPPPMQQPMSYPNFNPHFLTGASNLAEPLPALLPTTSSTPHAMLISSPASTVAPTFPPLPPVTLTSDILKPLTTNKVPDASLPAAIPSLPSSTTSTADVNHVVERVSNKSTPVVGASNSVSTVSAAPPILTSGLPPLKPALLDSSGSSQSSQKPNSDVDVIQVPLQPEQLNAFSAKNQAPTQPLHVSASLNTSTKAVNAIPPASNKPRPSAVRTSSASATVSPATVRKPAAASSQSSQMSRKDVEVVQPNNGAPTDAHHGNRGRGRGRGLRGARTVTRFTEEFDFMAMNEKFKKEEVWGHLGKNSRSHREKELDGSDSEEEDIQDGENAEKPKIEPKPVYKKDEFFDTLSCTTLDNGRTKYSEQIKIDAETFGDVLKYPGGRGRGRGGRGGSYYGRGYGYDGGRGRGRARGRSTRVS